MLAQQRLVLEALPEFVVGPGEGWHDYCNDSAYPQMTELVNSINEKLANAASPTKGVRKGCGKGNKGKSGGHRA